MHFGIAFWAYAFWDSVSGFPGPWLGSCILGWPVWLVIGYYLIGAYLSVSIVNFVVIGYHCNHLDGQLNWQMFTHCMIGRSTKLSVVQSIICDMAHLHWISSYTLLLCIWPHVICLFKTSIDLKCQCYRVLDILYFVHLLCNHQNAKWATSEYYY